MAEISTMQTLLVHNTGAKGILPDNVLTFDQKSDNFFRVIMYFGKNIPSHVKT